MNELGTKVGYIVEVNIGPNKWVNMSVRIPPFNIKQASDFFRDQGSQSNMRIIQETITRRIVQPEPMPVPFQPCGS